MELSIVILNYKVPYYLLLCLDSVYSAITSVSAEVIVIDNHSQDQSLELVKKYFPNTICIANQENIGFAKAYNLAIEEARGEHLCILNPDTIVTENCFTALLKFIKNTPDVGAIGTKLIDGRGKFLPESKRQIPTPQVALKKLLGNSKTYYYNSLEKHATGKVDILVGAFMFLKKEHYLKVKGFDERYFMYGEDIDLSYQLLQQGWSNYYLGNLTTLHFKGESTRKDKTYSQRFFGAMLLFYDKYYANTFIKIGLKLGIKLIKIFKSDQVKTKDITSKKSSVLIITTQKEEFWSLKNKYTYLDFTTPKEVDKLQIDKYNQVIFDANCLNYLAIIEKMLTWQTLDIKFRFKPKQGQFIIGSDSSFEQGEFIELDLR